MLSRRILTLSLLVTAVSAYFYFFNHVGEFIWPFGLGILLAMCAYIFQHQINWWWYKRNPPSLTDEIKHLFSRGDFYKSLDVEARKKFEVRASLFVEAVEFIAQGAQKVPEDIKYMVAYYAVMVSFYREDFLFEPYGRIVLYAHPFLSPNHPDHIHTYELEHEDGTVIFALEQLTAGFFDPGKYYQTGLHAFAELLARRSPKPPPLANQEEFWDRVSRITNWTRTAIEDFTGLKQEDPTPILVHHWFTYREKMNTWDPELTEAIGQWIKS